MIFAKVPIIKFFDNISQCDVDININNIVGIKNSFLLKSISLGNILNFLSMHLKMGFKQFLDIHQILAY